MHECRTVLEVCEVPDHMREIQSAIARRAYELFELNGMLHGCDVDHWLRAEQELLAPADVATQEERDRITVRIPLEDSVSGEIFASIAPQSILLLTVDSRDLVRVIHLPIQVCPESAIVSFDQSSLVLDFAIADQVGEAAA